jgi:hypothetical protein
LSERARKSADRIRDEVNLVQVLADYGFHVDPNYPDREQQFSCTLHGDGSDNKPSARYYPDGGQFYCFACGRSRDAITLVREVENLSFWQAVRSLEKRFHLDPLPWEPGEERLSPIREIERGLRRQQTPEQALARVDAFLTGLTVERSLTAKKCAGLWEAYDRVRLLSEEPRQGHTVLALCDKILYRAKEALKKQAEEQHGPDGAV